ncbi:uncharacterized protein LOC133530942 [Cydia pomonella]|uniref:uncharacterized protein LOC133530942 n=1 Tax=Cydia pomonella TaxID=82600 RepID=UPI002ADE4375|nr:uncharacterized protein LOC133530942 [Cydia pomonella]
MKIFLFLSLFLTATATNNEDKNTPVITRNFVTKTYLKHTSQNDVVNIIVPLNKKYFRVNEDEITYLDDIDDAFNVCFFTEADNVKGDRKYQDLYIYKNGETTKILENGRDATAFSNEGKAYLGACDGIYVYDYRNSTTYKYGSLTDNIIQIEANHQTGVLYFVTYDHQVFSVADEGTKKNKININDAQEIAFDFNNNLYYYDG